MRVLITGASGYLGGNFLHAAASRGHDVVAAVRRPEPSIAAPQRIMNVFDPKHDDVADIEAIVHFAAVTAGAPSEFYRLNGQGTLRLFKIAQQAGVKRFVHISSVSVYGLDGRVERQPELRGPYAGSKVLADQLICSAARSPDSEVVTSVLRPGLVYGSGMRAGVVGGIAIVAPGRALLGLGSRSTRVPIVHIDDLSSIIAATLESEFHDRLETWDVLSPTQPSRDQMIELFRELTGGGWKVIWVPSWFLIGIASVVAIAQTLRGRPRGLIHRVRRATTFDSATLVGPSIWAAQGVWPTHDPRQCLIDGLSVEAARVNGIANQIPAQLLEVTAGHHLSRSPKPVVVVGAGRVVKELHMPVLLGSDQWRVLAVVDQNPVAASDVAVRLGAATAGSLAELDGQLAGATVVIATPGRDHCALAQQALSLGADVIIEKPVSTTRLELKELVLAAQGKTVTAVQNYRLRPNVRRLWQAMVKGEVGPLRRIGIEYHSGRLSAEPAAWMRHDELGRTVLTELAIHFVDLACVAAGRIYFPREAVVALLGKDRALIRLTALGLTATGSVPVSLSVSVTGLAQRCQLTFEFERASHEVTFFPEGFRVLPIRGTPVDDLIFARSRALSYVFTRPPFRRKDAGDRTPHALIYQDHLARASIGAAPPRSSPFSLAAVADTMETVFGLQDVISAQAVS